MKNFKQQKESNEKKLKNISKKTIGGIILIAIMLIAYAVLSMQQIGGLNNIAQESAQALEDNEVAVTIIKCDKETGEALAGAVLKLEKMVDFTSEIVGEYTTNAEGKVDLVLEIGGAYTITETTAPLGYKMLENPISVTLNNDEISVEGETEYLDGYIYIYNEKAQFINKVRRRWGGITRRNI